MNPSTLREIYDRCDVSNNRTENPMSFEEFEAWVKSEKREVYTLGYNRGLYEGNSLENDANDLLSKLGIIAKEVKKWAYDEAALTQPEGDSK